MCFFYFYTSRIITSKVIDSIQRLSTSISNQLELEIRKMDTVSINIAYSNLVRDYFAAYLEIYDPFLKYKYSKTLIDLFVAMTGPFLTVQQVNLYDFQGNMIGAGFFNGTMRFELERSPWFVDVIKLGGRKIISKPYNNAFFVGEFYKDRYFISLYRVYFNNFRERTGIIETIRDYNSIFTGIEDIIRPNSNDMRIYVFNERGDLIYPISNNSVEQNIYFQTVNKEISSNVQTGTISLENPEMKEKGFLAYTRSEYTGWTVTIVQPAKTVMLPVSQFTRLILIITLILLALSLLLSLLISNRVTGPIKRLYQNIKSTELENLGLDKTPSMNGNIKELEELNTAFNKMRIKLKESMENLLIAKQKETEAKILALQSQISPHFLRNCLANISIMAEEGTIEPIISMCKNISYMLSYVSTDSYSLVKIETELDYVRRYLECIKIRYGESLRYKIEIDDKMKEIKIPKLLIQPLVENAVKYGTDTEPPWTIEIKGVIGDGYWKIDIRDSGPGFPEEKLEEIRERIEEIKSRGLFTEDDAIGIGIINVFSRLYLRYQDALIFNIENKAEGGALITIGGIISD